MRRNTKLRDRILKVTPKEIKLAESMHDFSKDDAEDLWHCLGCATEVKVDYKFGHNGDHTAHFYELYCKPHGHFVTRIFLDANGKPIGLDEKAYR